MVISNPTSSFCFRSGSEDEWSADRVGGIHEFIRLWHESLHNKRDPSSCCNGRVQQRSKAEPMRLSELKSSVSTWCWKDSKHRRVETNSEGDRRCRYDATRYRFSIDLSLYMVD